MGSHSLPSASAADAVAKLAAAEALKSTAASAASAPGSSTETASGTAQGASAAEDADPVTAVPSSDTPSVAVDPEAEAEAYERANVHNVYEAIAPHFSATRYKPWPAVAQFLHAQQPGYVGLDVGCGNGKYLGVNKNVFMVGSDRSANLVAHANERVKELQKPQQQQPEAEVVRARIGGSKKEKKQKQEVPTGGERESEAPNAVIGKETGSEVAVANDVLVADGLSLPFREGRADFAICIAVIHHMSTRTRRQEAIRQLLKCVRPGGQVMVYVWALEQGESRRGWDEGGEQDLLVPWVLKSQQPKPKKEKQPKASKQKQKWPQQQQQQQQQQTHEQANTPMQQQNHDSTEPQEAITAKIVGEKEATLTSSSILSSSSVPKDASMTIGGGTGAGVTEPASAAAAAVAGPDAKTDTGDAAANADAVFQRYYHLYRNGELEEDVLAARGAVVMSGYERDNWWVVATHATNDDTLQD
ncbi:S-adenosyl-L-methionine-dependent methyltransferase [Neurospora crassa]|nr:S-adenosyl-L-methionine-dependent methyltransferase [Neurospora crassa]